MKKISVLIMALFFIGVGASTALATPVLFDWEIIVDGTSYIAPDWYMAPEIVGEITNVGGFTMITPAGDPYFGEVPEAIGTVEVTFNPGAGGDYNIEGYFDVEIDEWINSYFNEIGSEHGSVTGDIYGDVWDDWGDISWTMGWDFTLEADEYAVVSFILSDVAPGAGFYLSQTDDDTGENVYLSSTLDIQPIPEPGTLLLLLCGLVGVFGLSKKRGLNG